MEKIENEDFISNMNIDHQHFVKMRVQANYVYGVNPYGYTRLMRERVFLKRHPERPLRYTVVARKVLSEREVQFLTFPVDVVRY
jgi:hypothetical protein